MGECMTQEDAMNMSNEQAIKILKTFRDMMIDRNGCPISDATFALDVAIKALSEQQEVRPVTYLDCRKALLKMWMDNVITDVEHRRISDRLNAKEIQERGEDG